MEPILAEFEQMAASLTYHKPRLRLISNVTGRQVEADEAQTAVYWRDHIRQPVQFAPSVQTLLDEGYTHFVEIGPQPTLLSLARQLPGSETTTQLASLQRKRPDWEQMLTSLGSLYEAGLNIEWQSVYRHQPRRVVSLPTYPFQRKRYWMEIMPRWDRQEAQLAQLDAGMDEWLYTLEWEEAAAQIEAVSSATEPGTWLVLADQSGIGDTLAAHLKENGAACHLVTRQTFNPEDQVGFSNLITEVWAEAELVQRPFQGIIHLWSLDMPAEPSEASLTDAETYIGLSILYLIQALAKTAVSKNSAASPRLWLVTAGAQAVTTDAAPILTQSLAWGIGKTIGMEQSALWGGLIDLDPADKTEPANILLNEIRQTHGEQQVAFRHGQRFVARVAQASMPLPTQPLSFRPDGTYLITGGLGALGLHIAEWMVQQGARRLVLLGRSPLPPRREWQQLDPNSSLGRKVSAVQRLEWAGAAIHTAAVDVSDGNQLANFLANYAADGWPPIRGVVHAAGVVVADQHLLTLDAPTLHSVLRPKVQGAWQLHAQIPSDSLDFFVLFSSFAAIDGWGAGYAAANHFMDMLAYHRRAHKQPVLTINWGPWEGGGMGTDQDLEQSLSRLNLVAIQPNQGTALLGHFLTSDLTQIAVMPMNADKLVRIYPIRQSIFINLENEAASANGLPANFSGILATILESETVQRELLMVQYLQECIGDVLRIAPQDIAVVSNVMELGLDSIMVMEMIQRLDRELNLRLYPREVFERPSVQALAAYLLAELNPAADDVSKTATELPEENDMLTIPQRNPLPTQIRKNPRAVFLLSTPRAGSTLLRVMLAGHPDLFCPPELHLLPFNDLAGREAELAGSYLDEGLLRAVMELTGEDAAASEAHVAAWRSENLSIPEVYGRLQSLTNGRLLVDKSPSYALDIDVLRRAEQQFAEPMYIHLVRHPYAVIDSFAKNRMDRLMGQSDTDPHQMGEQIWTTMNNNILDFREEIDEARCFQVRYEDLVTTPEAVIRQLCTFLDIEFLPALLLPYEGERMTDGVHASSLGIGDPNFHKRRKIEPSLAIAWQTAALPRQLGRAARQLAAEFAYELPWPLLPPTPQTETAVSPPLRREKPPIQRVARGQSVPLSYPQEQLWLAHQLEPESAQYNMPATSMRLRGNLDVTALQQSLDEVICRHEMLRTRFVLQDGEAMQVIDPPCSLALRIVDLSQLPERDREPEALQQAREEAKRPFDLEHGPLLRGTLLRLNDNDHMLLLIVHHIASDGWSVGVMMSELTTLYQAAVAKRPFSLPDLTFQYIDFATWQRSWLAGDVLAEQLVYWKQQLADAPSMLDLPTDFARPALPDSTHGAREIILLPPDVHENIRAFSRQRGVTTFMTLLTALKLTLYKWSGQTDVVIGTVVANRNQDELRPLIGCFMNFLALRTQIDNHETGTQLIETIRSTVFDGYDHQDCPYAKVVEAIQPDRSLGQNPLYNVAFLLQNLRPPALFDDNIQSELISLNTETSLLDLRFVGQETENGLRLLCEYNTDLFTAVTVQQVLAYFTAVLQQLLHEPDAPLAQLALSDELVAQAKLARQREQKQTIAIAATFTAEPVEEALAFWLKQRQLPAQVEFAPYNQVFQQLLDPAALLRQNTAGVNVLLLRFEDWQRYAQGEESTFYREIERNVLELTQVLATAVSQNPTPTLVIICPPSPALADDREKADFLAAMTSTFKEHFQANPQVQVAEWTEILNLYPVTAVADMYSDKVGHIPYTTEFFTALGTFVARRIDLLRRQPVKVIAVDCDNTLWQGVVGEDGVAGITISPAHQKLHHLLAAQIAAGRLVCLLSKNEEADVRQVFSQRSDMGLSWDQITAVRINWQPKPQNLQELTEELKLGLDSFLFLDDNPVECATMQAQLPEVLTLQFPNNAVDIPQFLDHVWAFDTLPLTAEDEKRAAFYQQEIKRDQVRQQTMMFTDFLAQLEMKIVIEPVNAEQMARVAQLTQRTNQFNATTIRRQSGELQQLLNNGDYTCLTAVVSDRFGDYGLVGVIIFEKVTEALRVDTLLLSCRAMGRGVEHEMLRQVAEYAQSTGVTHIEVPYIPSARNQPALNFLESIEAGTKQVQEDGWLFVYPVTTVNTLAYQPQATEPSAETTQKTAAPVSRLTNPAASGQFQQIATELATVAQIHQAMQAQTQRQRPQSARPFTAPQTDLEQSLAQIWGSLLGLAQTSIHDNFFELGGNSLLATRLLARLHDTMHIDITLRGFFETPTISALAEQIETIRWLARPETAVTEESEEREEFEI